MFAEDEAVVTFEHNLELKKVPLHKLMVINEGETLVSEYETVPDLEALNDQGDNNKNEEEDADRPKDELGEEELDDVENNINNEETDNPEESDGEDHKTGVEDRDWAEGEECVALWSEDGMWYKAVIDGVEGNTAVVTFTEYGNSAYCDLDNLREPGTLIGEDGQLVEEQGWDTEEWS